MSLMGTFFVWNFHDYGLSIPHKVLPFEEEVQSIIFTKICIFQRLDLSRAKII